MYDVINFEQIKKDREAVAARAVTGDHPAQIGGVLWLQL